MRIPTATLPLRLIAAGAVTVLCAAAINVTPAYASSSATPGTAGIGDGLFPLLGNGGYDVQNYDLSLTYPKMDPKQAVTGDVTITAAATQNLSRFDLDFGGDSVASVAVNGKPATFNRNGDELIVTPAQALVKDRTFTVTVSGFTATPVVPSPESPVGFVETPDGTVLTGQPNGAHNLFPSNDHPRDKATYTITLTSPAGWTGTANGVRVKASTHGGFVSSTFRESNPMASELVQVAVGDFVIRSRPPVDGIPIRDVAPTRLADTVLPKADAERTQLIWMEKRAGKYPFENYGSLFIGADLGGAALETQTLPLYDVTASALPPELLNPLMVHELSHQWFGDSVAPANWSDVWQNEGHAAWYEYNYASDSGTLKEYSGFDTLDDLFKAVYTLGDQWRAQFGPVASPLKAETLTDLFNPNVYFGGALALYALQQKIGAAEFQEIERAWVTENRGKSRSTDDFIALASKVSAQDLTGFLNSWLYGSKTPPMPGHSDWTVSATATSAPLTSLSRH